MTPQVASLEESKEDFQCDEEPEVDLEEEAEGELDEIQAPSVAAAAVGAKAKASGEAAAMRSLSVKQFYKEMAKIKEKSKVMGGGTLPPKKSASAYIIFQKEKRPEILARNPNAKVTEVVKEIARCWSLLTKEDRVAYKIEAKRDKERYERELKTLENQSSTIKKPKKCLSAYMIFVKETRPKIVEREPEMKALRVMQEVGRLWQSLSTDDRKYFQDKADNDKHRYLAESRRFYDEVARVGQAAEPQQPSGIPSEQLAQGGHVEDIDDQALMMGKARHSYSRQHSMQNQLTSPVMAGTKRAANQVMTMGLAPDGSQSPIGSNKQVSAQKRLRAESKFTFKPDEGSDDVFSNVGFENEEEDCDDLTLEPKTAQQYFYKELRAAVFALFTLTKPKVGTIKAVASKRWNELSMAQKSPFETMVQMQEAQQAKGSKARRGVKANSKNKDQQQSLQVSVGQLTRANQKLANEALTLTESAKAELSKSAERRQAEAQQQQENAHQQLYLHQDSDQQKMSHHQANGQLDLELGNIQKQTSGMLDVDNLSAVKGGWPQNASNLNRYGSQMTAQNSTSGQTIQQNPMTSQALAALALQNPYLNPLGAGLLQGSSAQQHLLFGGGGQNSSDDLNMANAIGSLQNDQLQAQLLQQIANPQHQLNQQQILYLLAANNPQAMFPQNINNLLTQQAAMQQLNPAAQQLLNQNLVFKMAALNNQNQMVPYDLLTNPQSSNNLLGKLSTQETPQFAGLASEALMGENELNLTATLPNAATQPIQNIFYPTSAIDDQLNMQGLLNTSNSGLNPAQATPNTGPSFASLFPQEFTLPASATVTAPFHAAPDTSAHQQQAIFGQENHKTGTGFQHSNAGNQLGHSPQISPNLGPMNANDHSNNDQSHQNAGYNMWQQNLAHSKPSHTSLPKTNSTHNMLGAPHLLNSGNANGGMHSFNGHSHAQMTGNLGGHQVTTNQQAMAHSSKALDKSVNYFPMKDQLNTASVAQQKQQQQPMGSQVNLLAYNASGGTSGANTAADQFNNSQSVTPFLKPTTRARPESQQQQRQTFTHPTAQQSQTQNQQQLASPFLKGQQPPQGAPGQASAFNFNSANMHSSLQTPNMNGANGCQLGGKPQMQQMMPQGGQQVYGHGGHLSQNSGGSASTFQQHQLSNSEGRGSSHHAA